MEQPVLNMNGEEVGRVKLSTIFSSKVNRGLMHQALVRQLANARLGTHKVKGRSEVRRTGAKWYRQKGTGRARHGSRRAPIFVGGGVAHGPMPRDYSKRMPKRMRRAALCSALTVKAQSNEIVILDEFKMESPKTRQLVSALDKIVGADSALLILADSNDNVELSARNLVDVRTLRANYLNIRDLLGYEKLVVSLKSLDVIEGYLGNGVSLDEMPAIDLSEEE